MRRGSRRRLCLLSVAAAGVIGPFGAWGASAATTARTVPLSVEVIGSGTVHVTGSHPFTCRAHYCDHTFRVLRGRRILVRAVPSRGWKLGKWKWPCRGSAPTCTLVVKSPRQLDVTFLAPGDFSNPIKLGRAAMLVGGWRLKVNSATLNADSEVEAVIDPWSGLPANPTPQPGDQYTLVNVSMTNLSSPKGDLAGYVKNKVLADDDYNQGCTPPAVDLSSVSQVQTGQTETGNLCFEIPSGAAAKLMLDAPGRIQGGLIWFALH
jgi:hypothetical protein